MRISDWSSDVCSSDLRIALYLDEGSKYITVRNNVVDDAGKWLNINAVTPAVKMWLRVSTDKLATGNWHNGGEDGGWGTIGRALCREGGRQGGAILGGAGST